MKKASIFQKKNINFFDLWGTNSLTKLGLVAEIKKGTSITKKIIVEGSIPVIAGGQSPAYYHNKSNREADIITISASGANAGFVNYWQVPIFASDCTTVKSKDKNLISTKLIYAFLNSIQKQIYFLQRGQAQPHVYASDIENIQIPLPPIEIQEIIVAEIEEIEKIENEAKIKIEKLKNETSFLFQEIKSKSNLVKLKDVALMLKRGKSTNYGHSSIQIIKSGQARGYKIFDFINKYFVDNKFISDDRNLQIGDILINSTGVGTAGRVTLFELTGEFVVDSHITILRLDKSKALPLFVLNAFSDIGFKNIEAMATGQIGQIELSLSILQDIKIPLPDIVIQKSFIYEILNIDSEIIVLENSIKDTEKQKEEILKKYL